MELIIKEKDINKDDLKGNFIRLEVENIAGSHMAELRQMLVEEKNVSTLVATTIKKDNKVLSKAKRDLQP